MTQSLDQRRRQRQRCTHRGSGSVGVLGGSHRHRPDGAEQQDHLGRGDDSQQQGAAARKREGAQLAEHGGAPRGR